MNNRTTIRTASGRVPVIEGGRNSNNPIVTLTFAGGAPISPGTKPKTSASQPERPAGTSLPRTAQGETSRPTTASTQASESTIPRSQRLLPRSDVMLANLNQPLAIANPDNAPTNLKSTDSTSIRLVNVSGKGVAGAGATQLEETLKSLQQVGAHPVGAGRNRQEARRPDIVEVRGKRIAYLGYSDADDFAAGRWRPGTNPAFKEQMAEDIAAIRNQVDWVIVNYHWSQDLASYPADWQTQMAHSAIDQGADLVVGYHPEVLQGAEIYKGRVIAYSLGNFIFADQPQSAQSSYDSAVLKVSLKDDRMRLEFIPVEVQDNQAAIATGQKAKDILTYIERSSALFPQPMKSPTILDRLALDPNKPAPPSEFNPPAESNAQPSPSPDSFITYPNGTEDTQEAPQKAVPQENLEPQAPTDATPTSQDLESNNSESNNPEPSSLEPQEATPEAPEPKVLEPEAMLVPETTPEPENLPTETSIPEEVTDTVEKPIEAIAKPAPEPSDLASNDVKPKKLEAETWASQDQPAATPTEEAAL
ncbi:CapA family protein [Leptolyngbya sp. FACHB-16]|nr:CapA family protein [Leptolyngbya sp. FACHB-8]MBD2156498.1 CapA family protein [Leptolyngbya sp. FACHB-16]